MKTLRLLGLSAVLTLTFLTPAKRAFAACPTCTTDLQCQQCVGDPNAVCLNRHCAV